MTASHEHFEFLCGLAASEELTETEIVALRQHAWGCVACRTLILETAELTSHVLLTNAFQQKNGRLSEGMRERFVDRAIAEGVPLARQGAAGIGKLGLVSALLAMLLIAAMMLHHGAPAPSTEVIAQLQASPMAAVFPDSKRERPKEILLSRRHTPRPPRRLFPIYLGSFQRRDFSLPLNPSGAAVVESRFPAPLALGRDNALNLMANFQLEASSSVSRTFEYSGSIFPRFIPVCRCESP